MSKLKTDNLNNAWEKGTTNVFFDLEMPDADEKISKGRTCTKNKPNN